MLSAGYILIVDSLYQKQLTRNRAVIPGDRHRESRLPHIERHSRRTISAVTNNLDRSYSAAKRHKRHKQGMGWNMDLMEPVKLDLNRSRACSRCAFCAFLRLCLSSYFGSTETGITAVFS
jgi:hypothetical protein